MGFIWALTCMYANLLIDPERNSCLSVTLISFYCNQMSLGIHNVVLSIAAYQINKISVSDRQQFIVPYLYITILLLISITTCHIWFVFVLLHSYINILKKQHALKSSVWICETAK